MASSLLAHPLVAAVLWGAWLEVGRQPARRGFELDSVLIKGRRVPLRWSSTPLSPFATVTKVAPGHLSPSKRVLLVPPLSGSFAFIMRDVVESFLSSGEVEVEILEWINARTAPAAAGAFLFDDQIEIIARAMRRRAPRPHVVALCQAGPPSLAAAAIEAAGDAGRGPASLSLIGAPIRPSAAASPLSAAVDAGSRAMMSAAMVWRRTPDGGARRVYPAEAHLATLVATLAAQRPDRDELSALALESVEHPPAGPRFLDLACSFMDVAAEFAIDNLTRLYLTPSLSFAGAEWRGEAVDLAALGNTPIFAVEGDRDAIAPAGQTRAALDLAPGPEALRRSLIIEGAGHFRLFYGPVWRERVYPHLRAMTEEVESDGD